MNHNTFISSLVGLLSVLSVVMNFVCLFVMNKTARMLERPSSYFIINLLVVDILQAVAVFPLYIIRNQNINHKFWNGIVCDSFRFSNMVTFYMSTLGVPLIALDRLIGIALVFQHRFLIKIKLVLTTIVACWVYVLTLCIIPFISTRTDNNFNEENEIYCIYKPTDAWTISMLVVNCFVPYIAIIVCYKFFVKALIRRKSTKLMKQNTQRNQVHNTDKIVRLSIIITICYGFLMTPSVIYYILDSICPEVCFPSSYRSSLIKKYTVFIVKYLAFSNSLAPPLIYCFSLKEFRRRMLSVMRTKKSLQKK